MGRLKALTPMDSFSCTKPSLMAIVLNTMIFPLLMAVRQRASAPLRAATLQSWKPAKTAPLTALKLTVPLSLYRDKYIERSP